MLRNISIFLVAYLKELIIFPSLFFAAIFLIGNLYISALVLILFVIVVFFAGSRLEAKIEGRLGSRRGGTAHRQQGSGNPVDGREED